MEFDANGSRSISDGYRRGWGLRHSGLAAEVAKDTAYRQAIEVSGGLALLGAERLMNLFLILRDGVHRLSSRNVIEFGSYRGGTALFMASLLRAWAPEAKVFALDTFEGMPVTDAVLDMHGRGDFADTSAEALCDTAVRNGLSNLVVVKGRFDETFPGLTARYGLAHIDCDIIDSVRYAQAAVWPHLTEGAYVVFDDSNTPSCLGATQAVEEMIIDRRIFSEQAWPHHVFRA